nr:unnamed protein product [Trichobilharzia regenti]
MYSFPLSSILDKFCAFHKKFDKVVVFGDCHDDIAKFVLNHRTNLGPIKAIWSNISGNDKWCTSFPMTGWIESKGLTDDVFEYLTLPREKVMVEQIDKIDEIYGLNSSPSLPIQLDGLTEARKQLISQKIKSQHKYCRLYISSYYGDMHTERNLIFRDTLPKLRRKFSSPLKINFDHVDLRFEASEAALHTVKGLELCLRQATACDIFVLLLGDNYGWIPDEALVRALPDSILSEVNKFYRPGMSAIEMEYHMAKLAATCKSSDAEATYEILRPRIFVFIRKLQLSNIPTEHTEVLCDHDSVRIQRLNDFKQLIVRDRVVSHSYPSEFIGVFDNHPTVGNLDEFASLFLTTIELAIPQLYTFRMSEDSKMTDPSGSVNIPDFLKNYVNSLASRISPRHLLGVQHAFKNIIEQSRHSRHPICADIKSSQCSGNSQSEIEMKGGQSGSQSCVGGILIITGSYGSGKSTHLAALAMSLAKNHQHFTTSDSKDCSTSSSKSSKSVLNRHSLEKYEVLIHFCNGLPCKNVLPCRQLSKILDNWIVSLIKQLQSFTRFSATHKTYLFKGDAHFRRYNGLHDYRSLKLKIFYFKQIISFLGCIRKMNYVFLVDDIEYLDPFLLDWLPSRLPQNIHFIFTCDSNCKIIENLATGYNCQLFRIKELTSEERRVVSLTYLRSNGLCLIDSQLLNQIAVSIATHETQSPMYLDLVCRYIRLRKTHKEVQAYLNALPTTEYQYVEQIIKSAELECGRDLTLAAICLLYFCRQPLSTNDLFLLLNKWLFISEGMTEYETTWENDAISMLSVLKDKPTNLNDTIIHENNIKKFLINPDTSMALGVNNPKRFRLSPLTFHILIDELRPLLSISYSDTEEDSLYSSSFELSQKTELTTKISVWNLCSENLCFMSQSVKQKALDISLKILTSSLDTSSFDWLRSPVEVAGDSNLKDAFVMTIHKTLANSLPDLDDKLYHLLHAGELHVICHLLTSPSFISKMLIEHPSTLMNFLDGYPTNDLFIQRKWKIALDMCFFNDKIKEIHRFIQRNYEFLLKRPTLFAELSISQNCSDWIRTLGLTLLQLSDPDAQHLTESNQISMFYRINSSTSTLIHPVPPNMIYNPVVSSNGFIDVPTSAEINLSVNLLVYGTRCGTIGFINISNMRDILSFTGHTSSVQSLCLLQPLSPGQAKNAQSSQQVWLLTTSENGDAFIWDVTDLIHSPESKVCKPIISQIASLCGYHYLCVTTSAWHSKRQIIATGGLDCTVYLWDISKLGFRSEISSTRSGKCNKLHPFKSLHTTTYPISSMSFRLPDISNKYQGDVNRLQDVLAVGCWDGMVYFYSLESLSIVRSLSVSSSSICSLAYSPDGGNILATMDRKGELMLWNDDILWYQTGLIQEFPDEIDMFSDTDESKALIPNQSGRICFSKPTGQYIFQTGGGQFLDNYINIWDTKLWAAFGPWIHVNPSVVSSNNNAQNSVYVTCLTIMSSNFHIALGWSDGNLTIVGIYDGRIVNHLNLSEGEYHSSVQCIATVNISLKSKYRGCLLIVGYSSGAVKMYVCTFEPKINPDSDHYVYLSPSLISEIRFTLIDTLWSHSPDHNVHTSGELNSGTLCVSGLYCVAASGGSNCEVWFHFIGRRTGSKIMKSICLKDHNAPVTMISFESKHFATASKNRQVAVYHYDQRERTVALMHFINNAVETTITSLHLMHIFCGIKTVSLSVYIGSSDNSLTNCAIKNDGYQIIQTLRANRSPIVRIEFSSNHMFVVSPDGEISAWKFDKYGVLQFSHRFNVCNDLQSMNNDHPGKLVQLLCVERFCDSDPRWDASTKLYPQSSDLIDELESTDEDGDKNLLDPDAEVTTPSEADATPSTYEDSQDEFFECGYTVTTNAVGEIGETQMPDNNSCDKSFHLLNSSRKGDLVYRDSCIDSTVRFLCGLMVSYENSSTYAPFIPQYRGTLSGHSGLTPCALTSDCSTGNDDDCVIVTAAGQTVNDSGSDIRLWSMPLKTQALSHQPNQHSGQITCLTLLKITHDYSICISGCIDGSVMFWSVKNLSLVNTEQISLATLVLSELFQFKPLAHFFCSLIRPKYPVVDIVTQSYTEHESKLIVHYFIFIAYGIKLWRMHIKLNLSNQSTEDVENTFEQIFSTKGKLGMSLIDLDVIWSSETIAMCTEIGSFITKQCEIVAVLVNGDVIIVSSNERESFSFDQSIVQSGALCSSLHTCNAGIIATYSGTALLCKHTDDSHTFKLFPGYIGLCGKEVWIKSLSTLHNSQSEKNNVLYLAECQMDCYWKVIIANCIGDVLTEFSFQNLSLRVTAYCAVLLPTKEDNYSNVYLILATSDNNLHLLQCTINNSTQIVSTHWKL